MNPTNIEDIRDVHGPIAEAVPAWHSLVTIALVVVGALAVLLLARAIVCYFSRPRTPAEIALARIDGALAAAAKTGTKPFAYEVTEAVRAYIEARFSVDAPTRTTEELLDELAADTASPLGPYRLELSELLGFTDLVKYAGVGIADAEVRAVADAARTFVERSRDDLGRKGRPPTRAVDATERGAA